jgi:hypothetical protein
MKNPFALARGGITPVSGHKAKPDEPSNATARPYSSGKCFAVGAEAYFDEMYSFKKYIWTEG